MHPAVSVIIFTVFSGAGFGLMAMIGLGFPMPSGAVAAFLASFLAGGLAAIGLLSSTFHLGHPERAIKALSQWRTSWLSREGVVAILTLIVFAIYALIWMISGERNIILGVLTAIGALATVYCTSMIYAQLKTVPHWHTRLTVGCYMVFALMQGLSLAAFVNGFSSSGSGMGAFLAAVFILGASAIKVMWWNRADDSDLQKNGLNTAVATGLGGPNGRVKLLEKPHSGENYLTREMVFQIGRKHARKLRLIAMIAAFGVPLLLVLMAMATGGNPFLLFLAVMSQFAGLLAERWLFFAEARHVVPLDY